MMLFYAGAIHVHTLVVDAILLKYRTVQWFYAVSIVVLNELNPV